MRVKLKFYIPEIILGVYLVVAVFATGMVFESSRHPPASSQAQHSTNYASGPVAPENSGDKVTDWLLVLLNVFLVGSTLLLWKANNRSAKIAERALTDLEAPFISVKITAPGLELSASGATFGTLKFCFANYGRTTARILEFSDDFTTVYVGKGQPPPIDPKTRQGSKMPYGVIAAPSGETQEFSSLVFPIDVLTDEAGTVQPPMGLLKATPRAAFFAGYVRYQDIFSHVYVLGFCFLFDNSRNRWLLAGGDEYNYCRKEENAA